MAHRGIVDLEDLSSPLDYEKFRRHPGVLKSDSDGRQWLLVPSFKFRKSVRDHEQVARAMRDERKAKTEGGSQKKLTIKAPRAYCVRGRVYCLEVPSGIQIPSRGRNAIQRAIRPHGQP